MSGILAVERYFDAWNRGNAQQIVDTFGPQGSYTDPRVPDGVSQEDLLPVYEEYLRAFSRHELLMLSVADSKQGLIAVEWQFRAMSTGFLDSVKPSQKPIELRGASFFQVDSGRIASTRCYFDSSALYEQLGADDLDQILGHGIDEVED